jgi:hypothetical protein
MRAVASREPGTFELHARWVHARYQISEEIITESIVSLQLLGPREANTEYEGDWLLQGRVMRIPLLGRISGSASESVRLTSSFPRTIDDLEVKCALA